MENANIPADLVEVFFEREERVRELAAADHVLEPEERRRHEESSMGDGNCKSAILRMIVLKARFPRAKLQEAGTGYQKETVSGGLDFVYMAKRFVPVVPHKL